MQSKGGTYWILLLYILCFIPVISSSQPSNYTCATATAITIPPSGNICVNGTNAGSINDGTYNTCDVLPGGNQVWYTFVTAGSQNTVTVTPPGGPGSAQQVVVTLIETGCGSGSYNACNASPTANGTATANWGYAIGTQVIVQVTTNGADGNFQLCITSVNPPPGPGEDCANATLVCDKSTFSVSSTAGFSASGTCPGCPLSCFLQAVQQDLWYKFTVGQSGTFEFEGTPLANTEYDWAMYDITMGCPGSLVACNYNFANSSGASFGIGPSSCTTCPTNSGVNNACNEHCPTINVTAGNTYAILIDNYNADGQGFTITWGGTFLMAPTANFTVAPSSNCGSLSACFTNTSVTATGWNWDFANGNTSTVQNPACQNYTIPGTYMVSLIVTSASGCTDVASGTVTVAQNPTLSMSQTDVACFGTCTGQATVTPTGGTPAYTYLWSGGGASSTKTGMCQGTYTVTVTTSTGCTATSSVIITQPVSGMSLSMSSVNESCPATCDGSATATVSGGSPNYTYAWSGGGTGSVKSPVCDGTYTLTVTDSKSCTATQTVSVSQPAAMSMGTTSVNANCGKNDGSASVTVTGGTSPFTYLWSDGGTNSTITALYSGSYFVTVTDNKGCTSTSMASVNNIPGGTATASTTGNATCNGSCNGTAVVSMTGGTSPFTYLWSNGETNSNATILCSGTYTVTVTDAKGCTSQSSGTITQPSALSLSASTTPSNCTASDGSATVTVSGGTSPYSYNWSSGETSSVDNALAAGSYTVTVTDNKGCSSTTVAVVSTVSGGTASASTIANTACTGSCDGSAQVTITGGTAPYTYLWYNGETNSIAVTLCAGSYSVTVTDSKGCSSFSTDSLTEPSPIVLASSPTDLLCNNGSTGAIDLTASGGTGTFTYAWSNSQNTEDISNLAAGTYSVTATDANGCTQILSETVSEPPALALSLSTSPAICSDSSGSITATVTGGITPYTYGWLPSGPNSPTLSGVPSGLYGLVVTDMNGCLTADSVFLNSTGTVSVTISPYTNVSCYGGSNGSATATVTGTSPPYTYLWSNGGSQSSVTGLTAGPYAVSVTDGSGCTTSASVTITESAILQAAGIPAPAICNGYNNGTINLSVSGGTPSFSYLWSDNSLNEDLTAGAGIYTVTVTDANGCTVIYSDTITEPLPVTLNLTSNPASCGQSDGSVAVSPSDGALPYSYYWTPGGATSDIVNGLAAGYYDVTVTDANGCTATGGIGINNIGGPTITVSAITPVSCFGGMDGSITISAIGGTSPLTYTWSNGQTDSTATGLPAGSDTITVTDALSCQTSAIITVTEPPQLAASGYGSTTLCNGQNVTIGVNPGGGTPPYTYIWDNGIPDTATYTVSPVATTTYTVIVIDTNGCSAPAQTVTVSLPQPLFVSINGSTILCEGQSAVLTAAGSGGDNGPFTYQWSTGETGNQITVSPVISDTYTVTVTDNCGSTPASADIAISVQPMLNLNPPSAAGCPGETFTLMASGAITYWWSTEEEPAETIGIGATLVVNPLTTTYYLVHGYDGICAGDDTVPVIITPPPDADFTINPDTTTLLFPNILFTDASTGNPVWWHWDFGDGDEDSLVTVIQHTYSDTGTYFITLTVRNIDSCPDMITGILRINPEFMLFMPSAFTPNKDGKNEELIPIHTGIDRNSYRFAIFDRWGDLIWETTDPDKAWDGRANNGRNKTQQDVYVWTIEVKDLNKKIHYFVGHVTVVK